MVELEAQRAAKRKTGTITVRVDICVALREVIRNADRTAPRLFLCIRAVYQHMIDILKDVNIAKSFSSVYCQMLCQILEVGGYCSLIRRQNFSDLMKILTYFIANSSLFSGVDQVQNARALLFLIRAYPFDLHDHLPKVFRSLLQLLGLKESEEDSRQTLHVLTALNHVCLTHSINAGAQVLAIGEQLAPQLNTQLCNTRDPKIREQLILFFRVQVRLHRDFSGNVSGVCGIFSDSSVAKQLLGTAADLIGSSRLPKGKLDERCMDASGIEQLVDLIGDVTVTMTHLELTLNATGATEPPHKKKRQSLVGTEACKDGWEFIELHISHAIETSSESILQWLQLASAVVGKHGKSMRCAVADKLAGILKCLLAVAERHDIAAWTMRCLAMLASCVPRSASEWAVAWDDVWHVLLKRLGFPLPSFVLAEGLALLKAILCSELVEKQLVHIKQELIWALPTFQPDHACSPQALSFLCEFLRRFELQDGAREPGSPFVRLALLEWVVLAATSPESTAKQPYPDACRLDPIVISSLIASLVHPGPVLEPAARRAHELLACADSGSAHPVDYDLPESTKLDEISRKEQQYFTAQLGQHYSLFASETCTVAGPMAPPDAGKLQPQLPFTGDVPELLKPSNALSVRDRLDIQKALVRLLESVAESISTETENVESRTKKTLGVDTYRLCQNQCRLHSFARLLVFFYGFTRSATAVSDELATQLPVLIQRLLQHTVQGLPRFLTDTRKLQSFVLPTLLELLRAATVNLPAKLQKHLVPAANLLIGFLEGQDQLLATNSRQEQSSSSNGGVVDLTAEFDLCMDDDNTASLPSTLTIYSHDCALLAVDCLARLTRYRDCDSKPITSLLRKLLTRSVSPQIKFNVLRCLLEDPDGHFQRDVLAQIENILLAPEHSSDASTRAELLRLASKVCLRYRFGPSSGGEQPTECTEIFDNIINVFTELWRGSKLHWHTRRELCSTAGVLLKADLDRFDGLSSILLHLVEDPDFRVRLHAADNVTLLFTLYNEEEMIFSDVYEHIKRLLTPESADEERVTALLSLANIGCISRPVESRVLFELYSEASDADVSAFVGRLVACMAAALGYGSVPGLIEAHLQFIVDKWISDSEEKKSLDSFPVQLCDCNTVSEFVCKYANIVLPQAVYSMDADCFSYVAGVVGLNGTALVCKYLPAVFAYTFPLYYSDHRRAQKIYEQFLTRHAPGLKLAKQIKLHIDRILVLLIGSVSVASHPAPPDHSLQAIEKALTHISSKFSVLELLERKPGRVQGILLHLRIKFHSHAHAEPKIRALQSLDFLVGLLKQAVATPNIIRTVVHFLLEAIACGESRVQKLACEQLLQVAKSCVEFGGAEELGQYVNHIVSTLVPFSAEQPLANAILSYLIIDAGNRLGKFIGELDPLPDVPELSAIIERWEYFNETVGGSDDILRELKRFRRVVTTSASSPTSLQAASLSRLTAFCKENKDRLLAFADENAEGRELLSSLVWALIRLCSPQRSGEEMRLQAAKCLGELGVMNPYAIAFSSTDQSFSLAPRDVLAAVAKQKESALANSDSPLLWSAICTALYALNNHQVDPSIDVVVASTSCLRRVLATRDGALVLERVGREDERVHSYLLPWASSASRAGAALSSQLSQEPLGETLVEDELWDPSGRAYGEWLCRLSERLASTLPESYAVLRLCAPICALKLGFAEALFPYVLVFVLLCCGVDESRHIGSLLERLVLSENNSNLEAMQYLLTVLNFVRDEASARGQPKPVAPVNKKLRSKRKMEKVVPFWNSELWPDVGLLTAAAAAQRCAAFLTSIMFVEAWHDQSKGKLALARVLNDEDRRARQLLLNAYASINEPDSILGLSHQFDMLSQIKVAEHEGQWEQVAHSYDSLLRSNQPAITQSSAGAVADRLRQEQGLVTALQQSGFAHVTNFYLKGFSARFPNEFHHLSDAQFEHYWRSCTWTLDPDQWQLLDSGQTGFHKALHAGLRALNEVDSNAMRNALRTARLGLAADLQSTSLESTKYVHPVLVKLHMLEELENAWCLFQEESLADSLESSQLTALDISSDEETARWQRQLTFLSSNCFEEIEPLLALRTTILSIASCTVQLEAHLCSISRLARHSSRYEVASGAAFRLEQLSRSPAGAVRAHWEQCKVLWARGDHSRALAAAEHLMDVACAVNSTFLADVQYTTSKWLAKTGSAGQREKITDYLKKARVQFMTASDKKKDCAVHYTLARYLDGLYQSLTAKMASREWCTSLQLRRQKEEDYNICAAKVKTMQKGSTERNQLELSLHQIRRQLDLERQETKQLREEVSGNLRKAVQHYLYCLVHGTKHDSTAVFRVCSLWFGNSTDEKVNGLVNAHIVKIPSHKWVTLIYQIASRMSSGTETFQRVLKALIERIAVDHPYHSLYQIFALSNADKVQSLGKSQYEMDVGKKAAAADLLHRLRDTEIGPVVAAMEPLVRQYIAVALMPLKHEATKGVEELPLPAGLRSLKNLAEVPVVTAHIPLQPSALYENLVTVHSFSSRMKLVGGVHLPRLAVCRGSDGKSYRQLIKGNDDLRQDAVMQQMFHMVNTLLSADPETRKRRLNVRTYKVVPLSPGAGILQWVENTIPLTDYLIGHGRQVYDGAHLRYRPGDMLSISCRKMMMQAKDKLQAFKEVSEKFQPVFHHFFLEHYKQPAQWFEKRIDYTRSMASNSIVGYIVGLGDRHVTNILIDKSTAELVHIDLGVAFEQGKTLRVPETVPFRLTRDLVDAMGVTGTEGVYRRCCEETMRVLRQQHEALLTIVEVFVHDPLYRWALSPLRALALQRADDDMEQSASAGVATTDVAARDAEKTLSRVRQKLQGVEHGGVTSVEEQIALLIDEARDPARLCHMFVGWRAWV